MVEGSPRVNALPSSSSSTWPEMRNKSNPVSLLPHLVCQNGTRECQQRRKKIFQVLPQNGYKNMTCCEEQWLWFSGIHRKKMPHSAIKKAHTLQNHR